ncbi:MAG TPA: hypothetical protein VJ910_03850 [Desulfuromonadales bacterium]|nr:hypothetical protein [Desulfuromonadales bacterium]
MRRYIFDLTLLLAFAFVLTAVSAVGAELDAAALKQEIQQRAQTIREFRALLNDPDQTVRLAALDAMLKSDDIAMRELAYGICFNSADQAMRVVCLKNRFADLRTVAVALDNLGGPTEKQQKALADWGDVYDFEVQDYDEKTGQFTTSGESANYRGKGQVMGTGVTFSQRFCDGTFRLGEGGVLEGDLNCAKGWQGTYPGRISLQ